MARGFRAGGNIRPSRFVVINAAHQVVEASEDNARVYGIAHESTREAPGVSGASTNAAESGDQLMVYEDGDECLLEVAETVSANDELRSNDDGRGEIIEASGTEVQRVGARALEGGSAGEKIRVQVLIDTHYPAAT